MLESILWLPAIPIVFVLPGLFPAQLVTRRIWSPATVGWAAFFSVVLLPPLAFGVAMLLRVTVQPWLILTLSLPLGALGLLPVWRRDLLGDAGDRDL